MVGKQCPACEMKRLEGLKSGRESIRDGLWRERVAELIPFQEVFIPFHHEAWKR